MPVISLLTDFGLKDGNVGVMKGVIWRICPEAQISDLSHLISPQNISEAALVLFRTMPYFPPFSIHVAVVDPGVGTARRPMAARIGDQYYVGPDNGILTLCLARAERLGQPVLCIHLNKPQYWLEDVSHVFHGRDIFAPVAGHLAAGVPLEALGVPFSDPVLLPLPRPERTSLGWRGEIIHIDHFGNASSNLRIEDLPDVLKHKEKVTVRVGGVQINGLVNTFGERPSGELVALFGSTGNLLVCAVNGSAAARLNLKIGDPFEVLLP